ncbi:site-2 protease family protein [Tundrisphaera lichenicola]|uniref:site-2 protease family protein n=1 Tax=Tundrisphaera lichenicola TaxID=2029860 RepID=UPI003EBCE54F
MRLSWRLGRLAGIDLFLHPSALLLFFLVSGAFSSGLEAMAFVAALLGSIVLHELGHALMARRYGIGTADITLYLFGGVARLERMPRSAGPELLIALAGPAVNVAIAVALAGLLSLTSVAGISSSLVSYILYTNIGLVVFNLLPVFPMDGGRVLRALLSGWLGRPKATEVAASIGRVLAVVGGLTFLYMGNFQAVILAIFVYMAGAMELRQVRSEGRRTGVPEGFDESAAPPLGYRWADRGDGVWRLVPIMVPVGERDRSWS